MIEKIVLEYLNRTLSVPAYMQEPQNRPKRYVVFEKTGSSRKNCINKATFVIQSYAESQYEAACLNEDVKEVMDNMIYEEDIAKSELNTDYPYPDTTRKEFRYQAVYDLVY